MNTRLFPLNSNDYRAEAEEPSRIDRLGRRLVLSKLEELQMGQVVVTENFANKNTWWMCSRSALKGDLPRLVRLSIIPIESRRGNIQNHNAVTGSMARSGPCDSRIARYSTARPSK